MTLRNAFEDVATEDTLQAAVDSLNLIYARLATAPATATLQTAGNVSLASIDTKTPALSSGRVPVTIDPSQIAAITPPAAITGYATEATTAAILAQDAVGTRAIRRDADTSPVSDGQSHTLTTNAVGRLKVSAWPGAFVATTGTITTASSTVVADVARASNIMVTLTGTFVGVNVTFEVSIDGGTTWFTTQAVRTNANTIETTSGVVATGLAYGWELSVNAMTNFRVRATAYTSGTATVTILPGAYATEPIPAIATHPVTVTSGTITANNFLQPPTAAGGALSSYVNVAVSALALVKASAGRLIGYRIFNPNAAVAYIQVFNAASTGAVALGTTLPLEFYPVPAGATLDGTVDFSHNYSAGIVIAATTTPTGNTAVTTPVPLCFRYI